jgi:Protein of unknown function (DUF2971)
VSPDCARYRVCLVAIAPLRVVRRATALPLIVRSSGGHVVNDVESRDDDARSEVGPARSSHRRAGRPRFRPPAWKMAVMDGFPPDPPVERRYTLAKLEPLYAHYTSAQVAFEHVLPKSHIRLSPYRRMRDPVENKDIVPGTGGYGVDVGTFDESVRAMIGEIKARRDRCRLLSLTQNDASARETFGCCWARPRMWEQYADEHRGVCLLFDAERLTRAMQVAFSARQIQSWFGEVVYTEAGRAGSDKLRFLSDPRIFDASQRADAVTEFIEGNIADFFFLKTDDFKTEHE